MRRPTRALVVQLIRDVRAAGRTLLTEFESKQLLAAYGIPTVPNAHRRERRRGGAARAKPSAIRSCSSCIRETITHKTDVGGVQLNLADAQAVRAAYRAIEAAVRSSKAPAAAANISSA